MPNDLLDQMTQHAQGGQPPQPGEQPPGQPPQGAPAAPAKDSQQDKAASKGSPDTEGDAAKANPVVYEIPMGDQKRKFTPEQIASTMDRYAKLNYERAQNKPLIDVVGEYARANPGMSMQDLAGGMKKLLMQANEKNPTMGDDGVPENRPGEAKGTGDQRSAEDISKELTKWEEDNAATLPPGYKEMMMGQGQGTNGMSAMQQQLMQMQRMLQMVLTQAGGTADAARDGMAQAQQQQSQAIQRQIANNIDRVQQHLGIPDEKANDFMVFSAERGYTLEDFVDTNLTLKVMRDFMNSMNSPEMERMREIAKRRQAYTGTMGSTPAAGGEMGADSALPGPLNEMADRVVNKRQTG